MPNCLNCGAAMRVDGAERVFRCGHCGSVEEMPALVRRLERLCPSSMPCPMCASPLVDSRLDGYPLRFCNRCQGSLIAMEMFVPIIDAARAHEDGAGVLSPRAQNPGSRVLGCPGCGGPMLNHLYGGPGNLVIDTCERCRVNWLDGGELRRIARAARAASPRL